MRIFVPGIPAPGGSKKAFAHPKTGRIVVMDDAKGNAGWKQRVSVFARQAMEGRKPLEGPIALTMTFAMPRPKNHYGTGRNAARLKPWAETAMPIGRPDTTKLVRAAEDALKGILWLDDSQVVSQCAGKRYCSEPGVEITAEVIDGDRILANAARYRGEG